MQIAEQSVRAPHATPATPFVPIRFRAAEDFKSRPNYRDDLDHLQHKLHRIIGDYSFPKSAQIRCGLKECRTKHWHGGYVVETVDGLETNIGADCGKKYFSVNWGDLQTAFDKAAADRDLREWLQELLGRRSSLLSRAESASRTLVTLSARIQELEQKIRKEPLVNDEFARVVQAGGIIRVERAMSRDAAAAANIRQDQRSFWETIGRVQFLGALGCGAHIRDLLHVAVPSIQWLSEENLKGLDARGRREKSKTIDHATFILTAAEEQIETAKGFLEPGNIRELAKLPVRRPNERARRILQQLAAYSG